MTDAGVPEAWPVWLSREQLRAYLGGLSDSTLRMICPVAPIDLGANVLRYRRAEVDAWEATLPHRLPRLATGEQDAGPVEFRGPAAVSAPSSAIEKARARARG